MAARQDTKLAATLSAKDNDSRSSATTLWATASPPAIAMASGPGCGALLGGCLGCLA
jgi:hypothetical protein